MVFPLFEGLVAAVCFCLIYLKRLVWRPHQDRPGERAFSWRWRWPSDTRMETSLHHIPKSKLKAKKQLSL